MRYVIASTFMVFVSGCTFSVNPILGPDDLTTDIDLSGRWQQSAAQESEPNASPTVIVLNGFDNNSSYDAEYTNRAQSYEVHIGKLGVNRYLQFVRLDLSLKDDSPVLARVPVYGFARFELDDDELRVFPVDDKEVRKILEKQDIAYKDYEPSDALEWCIITERTSRLQELLRSHWKEMFKSEPLIFRRQPNDELKG